MADVHPFCGLHYNPQIVKDLGRVVAPPFDLIDFDLRQQLLAQDPFNVVRLILGDLSTYPAGTRAHDHHVESASTLSRWVQEGVLVQDHEPAIYVMEDCFEWGGRPRLRRGLFLTVSIEPLGQKNILPHERTLQGPIRDRLGLLEETQTHLSPVFMTFLDGERNFWKFLHGLPNLEPVFEFGRPETKSTHRLTRITSLSLIRSVQDFLRPHPFLIADGHHRYTTAYEYHRLHPELVESGRMLIYLVSSADEGLILSAIHRFVKSSMSDDQMRKKLSAVARLEACEPTVEAFAQCGAPLAWLTGDRMTILTPRTSDGNPLEQIPAHLFNRMILEDIFSLDPSQDNFAQHVKMLHDPQAVIHASQTAAGHGFWLKPMQISQVIDLARQGHRLPQKATFFYPKILSGLLFHSLVA